MVALKPRKQQGMQRICQNVPRHENHHIAAVAPQQVIHCLEPLHVGIDDRISFLVFRLFQHFLRLGNKSKSGILVCHPIVVKNHGNVRVADHQPPYIASNQPDTQIIRLDFIPCVQMFRPCVPPLIHDFIQNHLERALLQKGLLLLRHHELFRQQAVQLL